METFTTTSRTVSNPSFFQLFVKLIGGQTAVLNFTTPDARAFLIKQRIFEITKIPIHLQRLISSGRQLHDDSIVSSPESTIHLCLRLRGGKGGFGSLLRGAATKAGQKKTNNFDACRDMSGRRLRHVNAEKKLEEWRAEEEERRLEKIAEEFIQKAAKKGKKGVGEGVAEKYVEKYREESAKCVERVEMSVREAVASCGNLKRKSGAEPRADAKKLKIWMGKRKLGENDSDDEDEASSDDDEENEKSVVSDGPIHGGLTREVAGSSDSVTGGGLDAEGSGSSSYSSGSGDEKESTLQVSSESGGCSGGEIMPDGKSALVDPVTRGCTTVKLLESALVSDPEAVETLNGNSDEVVLENSGTMSSEPFSASNTENGTTEAVQVLTMDSSFSENNLGVGEDNACRKADIPERNSLDFDEFNSASEMEALGMERLKLELQTRGLKCGGTLQERAARLFLLKTTPLDKIPKKHLAKK